MCSNTLLCGTSTGTQCPYVPKQFHCIVFNRLHGLSHPGDQATRLVRGHLESTLMSKSEARSCIQC